MSDLCGRQALGLTFFLFCSFWKRRRKSLQEKAERAYENKADLNRHDAAADVALGIAGHLCLHRSSVQLSDRTGPHTVYSNMCACVSRPATVSFMTPARIVSVHQLEASNRNLHGPSWKQPMSESMCFVFG